MDGEATRLGRKPLGPDLALHLDGSTRAKERMQTILATVAGKLTIDEACTRLGVGSAMFYRLRTEALQAGLDRLEPRPLGRPPAEPPPQQVRELEEQVAELVRQLKTAEVRLELVHSLPQVARLESPGETTVKKTKRNTDGRRARKRKRQARNRRPR